MKIIDKTPYRSEAGEIDILGRLQGTLKYGLTWYNRIQAQDAVIAIIEKQLGAGYTLLRNVTLPNTEINLPLVLVGPPGVFLINVTHERGVYMAKDDEWGTITEGRSTESRNFVPARINQVSRTLTFGRVLQVYLDRQGFKGVFTVESILMAADPGMHIESTRPAVRIVMSDALERFAASLAQGRAILSVPVANDILQAILVGRPKKPAPEPGAAQAGASAAPTAGSQMPALGTYASDQPETQNAPAFTDDVRSFSFEDDQPPGQTPAAPAAAQAATASAAAAGAPAATSASGQPVQQRSAHPAGRKRRNTLTRNQWIVLGVMVFLWVCVMAGFIIYIAFFAK